MSSKVETAAITKLRSWIKDFNTEKQKRETALAAQLVKAIPGSLRAWREECGSIIVENLLEYGAASRKYRRDEGGIYGFTSLKEFERRFEELRTAWEGVVEISISWDGDYRFEATFTAI